MPRVEGVFPVDSLGLHHGCCCATAAAAAAAAAAVGGGEAPRAMLEGWAKGGGV